MFNITRTLQELIEKYAGKFDIIVLADNMTMKPFATSDTLEEAFAKFPSMEVTATEIVKAGFGEDTMQELWIYS